MRLLAIDAGDIKSAYIIYDSEIKKVIEKNFLLNNDFINRIERLCFDRKIDEAAIEKLHSMGMPVGQTTFDTIFMNGRIYELLSRNGIEAKLYPRHDIKMHLCNSTRAKDTNIRMALVNRFGEASTKKNPHDTYNELTDKIYFGSHFWSCLAVAMYHTEPHHSLPLELDNYGSVIK